MVEPLPKVQPDQLQAFTKDGWYFYHTTRPMLGSKQLEQIQQLNEFQTVPEMLFA